MSVFYERNPEMLAITRQKCVEPNSSQHVHRPRTRLPICSTTMHHLSKMSSYRPIISYHIISYHIVILKRQNRLKVGIDKPKLKVKMQSVLSDDDIWKRLAAKSCMYSDWEDVNFLAGRSRYSGQQLGKHGYRRLITWQVAPEDDWCL